MDEQHLHLPLLSLGEPIHAVFTASSTTTTAAPNDKIIWPTFDIAVRLLFIIGIGVISIWANNEASKGFVISVTGDMKDTLLGDKFFLFYVSNDEAARLVQRSTTFATKILYTNTFSKHEKLVDQVDIQLASYNSTQDYVIVSRSFDQENKYVLSINPLIMEFSDFRYRIRKEIQRGMTEVLLFDIQNRVPQPLLHGMVEYVSNLAGFGGPKPVLELGNSGGQCWEDRDPNVVAQFLRYCEGKSDGFIGRLYQAMSSDNWDEHVMDKALGNKARPLWESFQKFHAEE